jgi:molecular chaperone GrpE (heat shock protein)
VREAETGCAPVDEQAKNPDHDEILTANETQPCAEEATSRLERKIAALEEENSDLKDKLLRKAADFENFRKRRSLRT